MIWLSTILSFFLLFSLLLFLPFAFFCFRFFVVRPFIIRSYWFALFFVYFVFMNRKIFIKAIPFFEKRLSETTIIIFFLNKMFSEGLSRVWNECTIFFKFSIQQLSTLASYKTSNNPFHSNLFIYQQTLDKSTPFYFIFCVTQYHNV